MTFNPFKKKPESVDVSKEWNAIGKRYASDVNKMVEFGEANGWENYKGKKPEDKRDHLADSVYELLKAANQDGTIDLFRSRFPPGHAPLIKFLEEKGQSVEQIHHISGEKVVFATGAAYEKRQAFLLTGNEVLELDSSIDAIGKSRRNGVFAILSDGVIVTTNGWQGDVIASFPLNKLEGIGATEIIPFNDGRSVLFVSSEGIYLLSEKGEALVHPVLSDDNDWDSNIDMGNAALSNDNEFIVVGDQCSSHRVLTSSGKEVGSIGQQSEYPHFCMFSADDSQLITNSCHFYNGITIGVDASKLVGIEIEEYSSSDQFITIESGMRVYTGVSTKDYYIIGDANGYIKAVDGSGKCLWRHFLGSTLTGMDVSEDGSTLWVGSSSGMLHKLKLGKGHRDDHTIGNGNHYEEFRIILWKDEPIMRW